MDSITASVSTMPSRPLPESSGDLGLSEIFLANLALKHCFFKDVFVLGDLEERMKLSTTVVNQLIEYLKREKYVEAKGPDPTRPVITSLILANRYGLNDGGRRRAAQLLEYDAYVGPTPVTLEDYYQQVGRQSIKLAGITPDRLQRAFDGLVIAPELLEQLGPAAVSGKPLFLYGPSGNGKTTVALRLSTLWDDVVLIPYAIYVEGNVIRVFDAVNHKIVKEPDAPRPIQEDRRWLRCHRPAIVVGGELTLAMLDLAFNPILKYYEAPLQLKANNGMFLVDDFGRQQIGPQELLNRWIIPMENKQDFLCLHTGQTFTIPFDQFLVFATNLEPRSLVDDAFLRRIRSKVKIDHMVRDQFVEIWKLVCARYEVEFDREAIEYLLTTYYDGKRNMDACHPRDLLEQIIDYCTFNQSPIKLSHENLDRACRSYFVA